MNKNRVVSKNVLHKAYICIRLYPPRGRGGAGPGAWLMAGGRTSLEAVERFSAAHAAAPPRRTPRAARSHDDDYRNNSKYFTALIF